MGLNAKFGQPSADLSKLIDSMTREQIVQAFLSTIDAESLDAVDFGFGLGSQAQA